MLINSHVTLRFKPTEFHNYNWLYGLAPCFPVKSSKVIIVSEPKNFYELLCDRFGHAKRRIYVASLYIGTGPLERGLLQITKNNMLKNNDLKFTVLVDYQRGTRGEVNSKTLLQQFVDDIPDRSSVALYQTPRLQGWWSRWLPPRYNELVGLQHMKLYITDDAVLISGANCSNDYFQQRQDRYIEIEDFDLANFYCDLIDVVSSCSKKCVKHGTQEAPFKKDEMVRYMHKAIITLIDRGIDQQHRKLTNFSGRESSASVEADTWVFPLVQMGEFGVHQEQTVTRRLFAGLGAGHTLRLATGYFNLTEQYEHTLLRECRAAVTLLMAHPTANGFLGAGGVAGGIPHAYSLLATRFMERVMAARAAGRVRMLEWRRAGWTFHAKGLWVYGATSEQRVLVSGVGSGNLGLRSATRDLETSALILTASGDLQRRLHEECSRLHAQAGDCARELGGRRAPLWVRAIVNLFRAYF